MVHNTQHSFGLMSKLLHWLSALSVLGLFVLGYWMVDLTYYSSWYKTAPYWHKSIGILLLLATLFRLVWKTMQTTVMPLSSHSKKVKLAASLTHKLLYTLLLVLMASGYLISTADGRAIEVFNWFAVPSLGELIAEQAEIAGVVHKFIGYALISLSILHGGAAIKHHFYDKDDTLKRMTTK